MSGSKWATGHLCGASGALEAVLTVLCVANDLRIPVPIQDIDPVIDFNISTAESVHGKGIKY